MIASSELCLSIGQLWIKAPLDAAVALEVDTPREFSEEVDLCSVSEPEGKYKTQCYYNPHREDPWADGGLGRQTILSLDLIISSFSMYMYSTIA